MLMFFWLNEIQCITLTSNVLSICHKTISTENNHNEKSKALPADVHQLQSDDHVEDFQSLVVGG
jgi:hypothetical protein